MTAASPDPSGAIAVTSPEGTSVRYELASLSERATAFMIDIGLTQVAGALVALVAMLLAGLGGEAIGGAVFALSSFFFRNVYFAACELRWSGQTIGKRKLGIRAIARDGGALSGRSILARNLTRELEFFLPLVALSRPEAVFDVDPRLALPIVGGWLAIFVFLPLVNRERMRCGDLLGGTVVVRVPEPALLPELVREDGMPTPYAFTQPQLAIYGIAELEALEKVLRRAREEPGLPLAAEVSRRIRRKIGWSSDGHVDDQAFLEAFYEAQRAHLEHRMILGSRKESKSA